jgi:hypothetical protein
MKNFYFLLSLVVLFPWIAGLIRFKHMQRMYRPFILLITVAVLTEIVSRILIAYYKNNLIAINIYSLIECLLIITQFYFWRYHSRTRRWYPYFGLLCIVIWIADNLIPGRLTQDVGTIFRVSAAFVVVILSINEINFLIIHENRNLLKNARFLICTGWLIYFLYEVLLEGFSYITKINQLSVYVNLLVNIIYGISVCFIPRRSEFTFKNGETSLTDSF